MQTYSSRFPQSAPVPTEAEPPLLLCCPAAFDGTEMCDVLLRDTRVTQQVPLQSATARLTGLRDARLLLLHEDAGSFIRRKLVENVPPLEAARQWQEAIQPVLAVLRANRKNIFLMRISMIRAYPEVFASQLKFSDTTARDLGRQRPAPAPALLNLIADHAQMLSPDIRRLATELEASLLDLSNGAPDGMIEPDTAFQTLIGMEHEIAALRAERDALALQTAQFESRLDQKFELHQAEVANLQTTIAGLQAQIAGLQATIDAQHATAADLQARIAGLEAQIAELEAEDTGRAARIAELEAENTALQEAGDGLKRNFDGERTMLMQMLQQVQKDLEIRYGELRGAQAKLRDTEAHNIELRVHSDVLMTEKDRVTEKLAHVEAWLDGIMRSRSYRIMNPLRKLRAAMSRRS